MLVRFHQIFRKSQEVTNQYKHARGAIVISARSLATAQNTFDERELSRQEENSDKKVLEQEVVSIIKDIDGIDLAVEKIPFFAPS